MARCFSFRLVRELEGVLYVLSRRKEGAPWGWDLEAEGQKGAGGTAEGSEDIAGGRWLEAVMIQENQGFPQEAHWRGYGAPLTSRLTPLVVDMKGTPLVHTGDNLVVGAVEAVHTDHTCLLLGIGVVRVGGVEIVLKHSQAIQMLDLRRAGRNRTRRGENAPSAPGEPLNFPSKPHY